MHYFITGGCGFIGSHLVDELIASSPKNKVTVFDNLSSGKKEFLSRAFKSGRLKLIVGDLLKPSAIKAALGKSEFVFHLAANPDISLSVENPALDFKQGALATFNLLEAMRQKGLHKVGFASSSVIYGEPDCIPTDEDYGPVKPISIYGASKLGCEGLISAYRHMFGFQAWIFRFANIIGQRATHGVIYDFIKKLAKNPEELLVLGNGKQKKSYLHVSDCVRAMLFCVRKSDRRLNIFNLATDSTIEVNHIARAVIAALGLKNVKIRYTGGQRGWRGDVPQMYLSVKRLSQLGFKPRFTAAEALEKTVEELIRCRQ